jgi:hypothetical protein
MMQLLATTPCDVDVQWILREIRWRIAGYFYKIAMLGAPVRTMPPYRIVVIGERSERDVENLVSRLTKAIGLIGDYDAVQSRHLEHMLQTFMIVNAEILKVLPPRKIALIGRVVIEEFSTEGLASELISLAAHARLLGHAYETDANRSRIKCQCLKVELNFLKKVPGTIDLQLTLHEVASKAGCID